MRLNSLDAWVLSAGLTFIGVFNLLGGDEPFVDSAIAQSAGCCDPDNGVCCANGQPYCDMTTCTWACP